MAAGPIRPQACAATIVFAAYDPGIESLPAVVALVGDGCGVVDDAQCRQRAACGCFINVKARGRVFSCPIGSWQQGPLRGSLRGTPGRVERWCGVFLASGAALGYSGGWKDERLEIRD